MCARFSLFSSGTDLAALFDLDEGFEWEPHYNIAPTEEVPGVLLDREGHRVVRLLRWGLVPHWSKRPGQGAPMINARSESVEEKPAFRDAFARHRCLVPADGFFEWREEGGKKQPYFISRRDGRPLAFAGLWDTWRSQEAKLRSCSILTTDANAAVAELHDRMPVLIEPEYFQEWLDPETPLEALRPLLAPCDDSLLTTHRVTPRMGNPRYKESDSVTPIGQETLF